MKSFVKLKANLNKALPSLEKINVALLADSSSQLLTIALKGTAIERQFNFICPDLGHNMIDINLNNINSEFYKLSPDFVILYYSYQSLSKKFYLSNEADKLSFAEDFISGLENNITLINKELSTNIIIFNIPEINDSIFGNYGLQLDRSLSYQVRIINSAIIKIANNSLNIKLFDFNSHILRFGFENVFDPKLIYSADINIGIQYLPYISSGLCDIILASKGKVNKCLVLDLDNTLWGGIIGDDGIENIELGNLGKGKAYYEFQLWLKQLHGRGIILTICSKNEESIVLDALENHPEMVLRKEHFAVIKANWNNKADNIKIIKEELNIGFDSMIFIDDNLVEREMVRQLIPGIIVPELPEDCAYYTDYLQSLNLFETISYSETDKLRNSQYLDEKKRLETKKEFHTENDFLASLNMTSKIYFDSDNVNFMIPRLAQLSQRTNQFNLRTIRYTEKDFNDRINNRDQGFIAFELDDKFGAYGLISAVTYTLKNQNLFIDNWVMSCRVFSRGLENFIMNTIVGLANKMAVNTVSGEYLQTSKNVPVKDLFNKLGFTFYNDKWVLNVSDHKMKETFITSD